MSALPFTGFSCRQEELEEERGKHERIGSALILDLPGDCFSPHLQPPGLQGFPGYPPMVPVEVRAWRGCSQSLWTLSLEALTLFSSQQSPRHHLPGSGYPGNAHVSGEFPAGSGMGCFPWGKGNKDLPWSYLTLWWAPWLGKKKTKQTQIN